MTTTEQITEGGFRENRWVFLTILRKNPVYLFGFSVVLLFLVYSLVVGLDPGILGYNPTHTDLSSTLKPPSWQFPFGTDDVGRNVFLESLYGAPIDAGVGIAIVLLAFIIGIVSGAMAGYIGGYTDDVIMRITDVFLAFPGLVLAVAIAAALGPGVTNALIALSVVWWPVYTRLARGEALSVKQHQYILAAKASGLTKFRIVISHVIPNIVNSMVVYSTVDIGNVIILFSVISFLGLGAQPPRIDLGRIVYDGLYFAQQAPWWPILPGVMIFVIVISFAFTGDLISEYLNPRSRR